jgi:hypothetical protein
MNDEFHRRGKAGPAKSLQLEHPVYPGEIGFVIAAWMPDPEQQCRVAEGPAPETSPEWPWATTQQFQALLRQALQELEARQGAQHQQEPADRRG